MFDPCPTASSGVLHIQWLLLHWFWLRAVFIKLSFIVSTIPTLWFKNASAISYIDSLMNSMVLPLLFPLPVLSSITAVAPPLSVSQSCCSETVTFISPACVFWLLGLLVSISVCKVCTCGVHLLSSLFKVNLYPVKWDINKLGP